MIPFRDSRLKLDSCSLRMMPIGVLYKPSILSQPGVQPLPASHGAPGRGNNKLPTTQSEV